MTVVSPVVFEDIIEHWDDEIPCVVRMATGTCGCPATHAAVCRQCGWQFTLCGPHVIKFTVSKVRRHCPYCGLRGLFRELVRVVPL